MGKYMRVERERIALETFIEMHAPDEATEDVWRLLARRIVDVAKAEIREEIGGRLDVEAARVDDAAYRDLARDGKDSHRASQEVFSGTGAEGSGPGCCRRCGKPFELVRPGKSQPACACWRRYV